MSSQARRRSRPRENNRYSRDADTSFNPVRSVLTSNAAKATGLLLLGGVAATGLARVNFAPSENTASSDDSKKELNLADLKYKTALLENDKLQNDLDDIKVTAREYEAKLAAEKNTLLGDFQAFRTKTENYRTELMKNFQSILLSREAQIKELSNENKELKKNKKLADDLNTASKTELDSIKLLQQQGNLSPLQIDGKIQDIRTKLEEAKKRIIEAKNTLTSQKTRPVS